MQQAQQMPPSGPGRPLGWLDRRANQPIFSVKRSLWRKDDEHVAVADNGFAAVRSSVLQRDAYTCRFCGFKAQKYQEVHHLDDNHQNNDPNNLLTICTLCHQVHHLGMCAMRGGGFIAAIPELTQTEVNHLVRAIYVAEHLADAAVNDKLKSLLATFQFRGCDTLKSLYGLDISAPHTLAEILSLCTAEIFAKRGELFAPLRLVASREAFHSGQLEYYASQHRAFFQPENWQALTHQLLM